MSFDGPEDFIRAASLFTEALRDHRFDAALAQFLKVGTGCRASLVRLDRIKELKQR